MVSVYYLELKTYKMCSKLLSLAVILKLPMRTSPQVALVVQKSLLICFF